MSDRRVSAEPEIWPHATPEEFADVEDAIRRLAAVRDLSGYWTPIGKVVEALAYATEPGDRERGIVAYVLGQFPAGAEDL